MATTEPAVEIPADHAAARGRDRLECWRNLITCRKLVVTWRLIRWLLVVVISLAPQFAAGASPESVAIEIRQEATRPNQSPEGHPLPLVSHWTTGIHKLSKGWAPRQQIQLIKQGHFLLPWFQMPDEHADIARVRSRAFHEYYEWAIKQARDLHLPLVLVASQWERFLTEEPYLSLPSKENPNVVTPEGKVLRMVSPFGPIKPWRDVGRNLAENLGMRRLQEWYPDPPLVVFLSNNEHPKLTWKDAEKSGRYVEAYGRGRDGNFKRKAVADGWIARYRALQEGMRDGLASTSWKANAIFVGYDAFGPPHFGRWGGWPVFSLYVTNRIDPYPLMWDGGSPSYYTYNWNPTTDFTVYSPQIEFMNLVFQQREAYRLNPDFWLEFSVWDGYEPSEPINDKRKFYAALGQKYTPQRYAGMVQFGMWLLRPRVVREFRGWLHPWRDGQPYFMALVDAVDRVHTDPVLREWWHFGELVPNRAHEHPYQENIPPEYAKEDRWFLLDADVNPARPWILSTEIPIFALALRKGEPPKREWLVYAHAPLGDRENVQLTVPGYGDIRVKVTVGGSYYLINEETGMVGQLR